MVPGPERRAVDHIRDSGSGVSWTGALAILLWIGAYAIVSGVLMIVLGVRLRKWIKAHEPPSHEFPVMAPPATR